jgi:hypothetical protein
MRKLLNSDLEIETTGATALLNNFVKLTKNLKTSWP